MKNPMTLEVDCRICGKTVNLVIEQEDFKKFKNREGAVQNIFPYLSADEREMLISGICSDCWEELFNKHNKKQK
jgi:hypothetical protein